MSHYIQPAQHIQTTDFMNQLLEGVRKTNIPEFQKVMAVKNIDNENILMFKILQTLSNLHDVVSDMYIIDKNETRATLHSQLANRIRIEANKMKQQESV